MESAKKRQKTASATTSSSQNTDQNDFSSFLQIFPEELWLLVINQIEEQSILQNFVASFPEFNSIFSGKLTKFKFKPVSNRAFEYQPTEEHPQVEQIASKDWCISVYKFLQNHTPGTTVPQKEFQYFVPATHVYLQDIKTIAINYEVQRFHKYLMRHSQKAHQILGNKLIKIKGIDSTQYSDSVLALFCKFGRFIKKLDIHFQLQNTKNCDAEKFFKKVVNCLSELPNVRQLCLEISGPTDSGLAQAISQCSKFPELPKLRELEIRSIGTLQIALIHYLLEGDYFRDGTIEKLVLHSHKYWEPEKYFHCVVEYQVHRIKCYAKTVELFEEFLKRQNQKIRVVKPWDICDIPELFRWISEEQPVGEDLIIDNNIIAKIMCPAARPVAEIPSVKYLEFTDNAISGFRFLKALPSLEHLHIHGHPGTKAWFLKWDMDDEPLATLIRNYLYRDIVSKEYNIWNELPSLKSFTVQDVGIISKHFVREQGNKPVIFKSSIQLVTLE